MLAEKIPDEAIRTAFVATYELVLQQFGVDSLKKERKRIAAEREHIGTYSSKGGTYSSKGGTHSSRKGTHSRI